MSGHVFLYALVLFLLPYFANVRAFNGRCPAGWIFFEHSCYKLYTTPAQSFPVAQSKCESLGASLTSISSAKENQFIYGITESSSVWIGLNDIRHEGVFEWMDGSQFRYRWDTGYGCTSHLTPNRTPPIRRPNKDERHLSQPGYTHLITSTRYRYCHDAELDYSRWWQMEPRYAASNCVVFSSNSLWYVARSCGSKYQYMCKKEAHEEGTLPETSITCPHSFETVLELGASKTTVTWSEPAYQNDSLASHIEGSHSPGAEFGVGVTWVNYTFEDAYDSLATCNFSITVLDVDTTPPRIVLCPSDVTVTKITNLPLTVTWEPPVATDLSESVSLVSQSHFPGDEFEFGVNNVTYKFTDDSGNKAVCFFRIYVIEVNNNIVSSFNVDEPHEAAAVEAHEVYEAHDLVINEFRGTYDNFHGIITGLFIFLGFVGLTLALLVLFVIKVLRTKSDSDGGKFSYVRMDGDAEVQII